MSGTSTKKPTPPSPTRVAELTADAISTQASIDLLQEKMDAIKDELRKLPQGTYADGRLVITDATELDVDKMKAELDPFTVKQISVSTVPTSMVAEEILGSPLVKTAIAIPVARKLIVPKERLAAFEKPATKRVSFKSES